MKIEKISLKGVKNILGREELKKIMAGSGGGCLSYMQTGCNVYGGQLCCMGYICNPEDGPTGGCTITMP